jgi:hypothetical protein
MNAVARDDQPPPFATLDDALAAGFVDVDALESWLEHVAQNDQPDEALDDNTDAPSPSAPLQGLRHIGPLALVGASEIRKLARVPIDWVWKDYVVSSTIGILSGPSSEGKTTLLFLLLLARATVGPPLEICGRAVTPAPLGRFVVLVEAEHGDASTARKLVKSADLLGLGDDALDRIISVSRKAVLLGSDEWRDIERMIAAGIVSDVAIDSLARVGTGDANAEKDQVANFQIIADALEKAPAGAQPAVWVIAHSRKGVAETLDDVGGSMQRVAQADSVILVNGQRDANGKIVASSIKLSKAREEPVDYPEVVTLEIKAGKLVWSTGKPRDKSKHTDVQLTKVRAWVEADGSLVASHVSEGCKIGKPAALSCLRALEAEGVLTANVDTDGRVKGWSRA